MRECASTHSWRPTKHPAFRKSTSHFPVLAPAAPPPIPHLSLSPQAPDPGTFEPLSRWESVQTHKTNLPSLDRWREQDSERPSRRALSQAGHPPMRSQVESPAEKQSPRSLEWFPHAPPNRRAKVAHSRPDQSRSSLSLWS